METSTEITEHDPLTRAYVAQRADNGRRCIHFHLVVEELKWCGPQIPGHTRFTRVPFWGQGTSPHPPHPDAPQELHRAWEALVNIDGCHDDCHAARRMAWGRIRKAS